MNIKELLQGQNQIKPTCYAPTECMDKQFDYEVQVSNEYMLKTIPLDIRLKVIYLPLMLIDNSMQIIGEVRDVLAQSWKAMNMKYEEGAGAKKAKQLTKGISEMLNNYSQTITSELEVNASLLRKLSGYFRDILNKMMFSYQKAYINALNGKGCGLGDNAKNMLASIYMAKELITLKFVYEEDLVNEMNGYLKGTKLKLYKSNSDYDKQCVDYLYKLLDSFGAPHLLESEELKLCRVMMIKDIDEISYREVAEFE